MTRVFPAAQHALHSGLPADRGASKLKVCRQQSRRPVRAVQRALICVSMTDRAPFRLGLTGSIGMGKSTVSMMFRDEGVPIVDADAIVHNLYKPDGAAVEPLLMRFPTARGEDGGVSRALLSREVVGNEAAMKDLEAIVHPLVVSEREKFLAALPEDSQLVVFDIPLLYETEGEVQVDAVAVVSCPYDVQRERVLARPGMTEGKFEAILARQVPDEKKRTMADHVINTGQSMEDTRAQMLELIHKYSRSVS